MPLEVQALIEARVNTQLDAAREMLRHEASDARRETNAKALIRYGALVLCNVLFAIFIWVFDSSEVKELTRRYVTENMNKPTLEEAARDVVTNKMASFVSQQLGPLARGVTTIRSNIADADQAMRQLRDEQRLITVVGRAEALDAEAFRELLNLAQGTNEIASLADAMVRSVRRTLRSDRSGPTYDVPVMSTGEHDYGGPFTDDELAFQLVDRAGIAVGAVNIIGNEKRMVFVPDLVEIAHTSKDLWLLNRVSLALEKMVGVKFSAWDPQPLDRWWSDHKASYTNWPISEYKSASVSQCLQIRGGAQPF